jgi:hypothetical protein
VKLVGLLVQVPVEANISVTEFPAKMDASPALSTAAQNVVDGQDTLVRDASESTVTALQADAPPVGFVEVRVWPALSTAAQKELDEQEMLLIVLDPSMTVVVHVPLGFVAVEMVPLAPTSTQRPLVEMVPGAQDRPCPLVSLMVSPVTPVHEMFSVGLVA